MNYLVYEGTRFKVHIFCWHTIFTGLDTELDQDRRIEKPAPYPVRNQKLAGSATLLRAVMQQVPVSE
jgi:hypothetical protein